MTERTFIGHRNGIIKWFNLAKGYGVLFEVGNRKEKIILQASDSKRNDLKLLDRNSKVKFDLVRDLDDQLLATNVRLAQKPKLPKIKTQIRPPRGRRMTKEKEEIQYFSDEEDKKGKEKKIPKPKLNVNKQKRKDKGKILDIKKRSSKNWQYGFQTYPPPEPKEKESFIRHNENAVRRHSRVRRRPRYFRVSESPEYKRRRRKKSRSPARKKIPVRTFSDSSEEEPAPKESAPVSIQPLASATMSAETDQLTTKQPIAQTPNVNQKPEIDIWK